MRSASASLRMVSGVSRSYFLFYHKLAQLAHRVWSESTISTPSNSPESLTTPAATFGWALPQPQDAALRRGSGQALLRAGLRTSSRRASATVRAVTGLWGCIDGLLARATQTQHDAPPVFKPDFIPFDLHQGWAGGCDGEHNFAADDVFFQFDDLCLAFGFALLGANLSQVRYRPASCRRRSRADRLQYCSQM